MWKKKADLLRGTTLGDGDGLKEQVTWSGNCQVQVMIRDTMDRGVSKPGCQRSAASSGILAGV